MMRILLTYILPLALPTLVYVIWSTMAARRGDDTEPLSQGPWFALIVAGFALILAALVATVMFGGMDPEGEYIAPYSKDGKIVPGHIEPAPGKEAGQ